MSSDSHKDGSIERKSKIFCGQQPESEVEGDKRFRKKRKAAQVGARNLIKWSTPGHGMTWREKYNCCVLISEAG